MMRGVSQVMASVPEHVRSIWKEAVGTDPTEEDVAGAVETLARGDVTVALAREHQIAVMLERGAAVFPFFFGRRWFLARGHDLVTSDNPVILWARNVPRGWGRGRDDRG